MKKVLLHSAGIMTAVFITFTLGLFIGRQQLPQETIPAPFTTTAPTSPNNENKINLNTATVDDLCTLPGIGFVTANYIIEYRTEHGGFTTIEQLLEIKGIGYAKFDELLDLVYIE